MITNEFVIRLAVGDPNGLRSATFRIWVPSDRSDVYASVRERAGEFKVSLHESGFCIAGLTKPFATRESKAVKKMGGSRVQNRWKRRVHVGPKVVSPLQFSVPESELRKWENPACDGKITWLSPPLSGRSIIVSCLFSGKEIDNERWPGRQNGTQLLGSKLLPNGEKFWVVWQDSLTSVYEKSMLEEAREVVNMSPIVRFSTIDNDSSLSPRILIFKELPLDQLLVVLDAASNYAQVTP